MTAGPWRPIHLHSYSTRIKDLRVSSNVNSDLAVDLDVSLLLDAPSTGTADVVLLNSSNHVVVNKNDIKLGNGDIKERFHLAKEDVELWYPVGYGKQPLYSVRVAIKNAVCPLSTNRIFSLVHAHVQLWVLARTSDRNSNTEDRLPSCVGGAGASCRPGRPNISLRDQ